MITRVLVALTIITTALPVLAQVGALDTTFDGDGRLIDHFGDHDYAYDSVITPDGSIFVVGTTQTSSNPNTRDPRLVKYNASGAQVDTWNYPETPCGSVPESFYSVELAANGDLIMGGYAQTDCSGSHRDFYIIRASQSGAVLDRFDKPNVGLTDYLQDIAIQPDGKVIGVGYSSSTTSSTTRDFAVVRWNTDGTVDETGFATDGVARHDVAGDQDILRKVKIRPDGKIVAAGTALVGGQYDMLVVRLNADGSLDTSLGGTGIVTVDFFGFSDTLNDLVCLPGGKMLAAGKRELDADNSEMVVARFNSDGSLDTGFGVGGVVSLDFGGPRAAAAGLIRQLDGRLVVAGGTEIGAGGDETYDFAIARLYSDGTINTGFNGTGSNVVDMGLAQFDGSLGFGIQPDGDLVMVGYTQTVVDGVATQDLAIARFVGDTGTESMLFIDGFESGDTSFWD